MGEARAAIPRQPSAWLLHAVLLLVVAAALGFAAVVTQDVALGAAVLVLMVAAVRLLRIGCWISDTELHVRNIVTSYTLRRDDILAFGVVDAISFRIRGRDRTVHVVLRGDKTRAIAATARGYFTWWPYAPRPGARTEADLMCDRLNAWLVSDAGWITGQIVDSEGGFRR